MREYSDLLRQDFETYLSDVTRYFMCMDKERDRALREARMVGEEYRRFLGIVLGSNP